MNGLSFETLQDFNRQKQKKMKNHSVKRKNELPLKISLHRGFIYRCHFLPLFCKFLVHSKTEAYLRPHSEKALDCGFVSGRECPFQIEFFKRKALTDFLEMLSGNRNYL